jgi:hypothetical protein
MSDLTLFVMRVILEFSGHTYLETWLEKLNLGPGMCQLLGLDLDVSSVMYYHKIAFFFRMIHLDVCLSDRLFESLAILV